MDSSVFLAAAACISAFAAGLSACKCVCDLEAVSRWRRVLRHEAASDGDARKGLLSGGFSAYLISIAVQQSCASDSVESKSEADRKSAGFSSDTERLVCLAGLKGRIVPEGYRRARAGACTFCGIAGFLFGLTMSVQFAFIGALAGAVAGSGCIAWALKQEGVARRQLMESHLSEALEVLCLGLRSGLSFDYALGLYCDFFQGVLSAELKRAFGEWSSGLKSREQALRDVASGYESALFLRVVESVIRAMRFGTPLAGELESLAAEARQRHKADVEEKVMKAPVKMMLPVGTLILPSMLILVLGPVLLGLVDGF